MNEFLNQKLNLIKIKMELNIRNWIVLMQSWKYLNSKMIELIMWIIPYGIQCSCYTHFYKQNILKSSQIFNLALQQI